MFILINSNFFNLTFEFDSNRIIGDAINQPNLPNINFDSTTPFHISLFAPNMVSLYVCPNSSMFNTPSHVFFTPLFHTLMLPSTTKAPTSKLSSSSFHSLPVPTMLTKVDTIVRIAKMEDTPNFYFKFYMLHKAHTLKKSLDAAMHCTTRR